MKQMQAVYPHMIHHVGHRSIIGSLGERLGITTNSGLMMLSKYPIIDADFIRYSNLSNADILSNKGLLGAKVKVSDDRFVTVYNTHMQAAAWKGFNGIKKLLNKIGQFINVEFPVQLSGEARNEQFELMLDHIDVWAEIKPSQKKYADLKFLNTHVLGDMNEGFNNIFKSKGISHGKKASRVFGDVKYPGKEKLYKRAAHTDVSYMLGQVRNESEVENFFDISIHQSIKVLRKKQDPNQAYTLASGGLSAPQKIMIKKVTSEDTLSTEKFPIDLNEIDQWEVVELKKGIDPSRKALFDKLKRKLDFPIYHGSTIHPEKNIEQRKIVDYNHPMDNKLIQSFKSHLKSVNVDGKKTTDHYALTTTTRYKK